MKILIVHNSYGRYSGEEAVVDRTAAMFRSMGREMGHQVACHILHAVSTTEIDA